VTKPILFMAGILMLASGHADRFVRKMAPIVALTHVRIVDGTGKAGSDDQTLIIENGRVSAVGAAATVTIPTGASTLDLHGRTVMPGLVGLQEHLFYQLESGDSPVIVPAQRTFAKLYLASGVTTIRTAGSPDRKADARIKDAIETGDEPGPKIHFTASAGRCMIGVRQAVGLDQRATECSDKSAMLGALLRSNAGEATLQQTIAAFVRDGAAIVSTLAVVESYAKNEPEFDPRVQGLLSSRLHEALQQARDRRKDRSRAKQAWWADVLRREMTFERAFAAAGGALVAGADPSGWGATVAGYADQRGLELLVAAGFSPEQSIAIATSNGARFLEDSTIGEIAAGRQADLMVVEGNPSRRIADVRNVELVFKDGIAYEPDKLTAAAAGTLGEFTLSSKLIWPVTIVLTLLAAIRATRMLRRRRPANAA